MTQKIHCFSFRSIALYNVPSFPVCGEVAIPAECRWSERTEEWSHPQSCGWDYLQPTLITELGTCWTLRYTSTDFRRVSINRTDFLLNFQLLSFTQKGCWTFPGSVRKFIRRKYIRKIWMRHPIEGLPSSKAFEMRGDLNRCGHFLFKGRVWHKNQVYKIKKAIEGFYIFQSIRHVSE